MMKLIKLFNIKGKIFKKGTIGCCIKLTNKCAIICTFSQDEG
jgi:hypothetical protein